MFLRLLDWLLRRMRCRSRYTSRPAQLPWITSSTSRRLRTSTRSARSGWAWSSRPRCRFRQSRCRPSAAPRAHVPVLQRHHGVRQFAVAEALGITVGQLHRQRAMADPLQQSQDTASCGRRAVGQGERGGGQGVHGRVGFQVDGGEGCRFSLGPQGDCRVTHAVGGAGLWRNGTRLSQRRRACQWMRATRPRSERGSAAGLCAGLSG
jgi:hypothetical protein